MSDTHGVSPRHCVQSRLGAKLAMSGSSRSTKVQRRSSGAEGAMGSSSTGVGVGDDGSVLHAVPSAAQIQNEWRFSGLPSSCCSIPPQNRLAESHCRKTGQSYR